MNRRGLMGDQKVETMGQANGVRVKTENACFTINSTAATFQTLSESPVFQGPSEPLRHNWSQPKK